MIVIHRSVCSYNIEYYVLLLGLLYSITTSLLAYSAYHLTEIEENIYKICHIKCVSEFLHYE